MYTLIPDMINLTVKEVHYVLLRTSGERNSHSKQKYK